MTHTPRGPQKKKRKKPSGNTFDSVAGSPNEIVASSCEICRLQNLIIFNMRIFSTICVVCVSVCVSASVCVCYFLLELSSALCSVFSIEFQCGNCAAFVSLRMCCKCHTGFLSLNRLAGNIFCAGKVCQVRVGCQRRSITNESK